MGLIPAAGFESARLNFRAGVETPDGLVRHRVEVRLNLLETETLSDRFARVASGTRAIG